MILITTIIFSVALGSFANTVISYYANIAEFDLFRSKCFCGKKYLKLKHLFPIFSFIVLRGNCAFCGERISVRYILVESLALLIGITSYLIFTDPISILIFTAIYIILLSIGLIDYYTYTIPNSLILLIIILFCLKALNGSNFELLNLLTALLTSVLFLIVNFISLRRKGLELIGYGDIKLIFVLLLGFSFPLSLIALWFSSFIAIPGFAYLRITNKKFNYENRVPYGLFLAISFIVTGLSERQVIEGYINIF